MSSIPARETLKEKAPIIRKFLKEKYELDISQGHSLELIAKIFGFKDWNTASAASKSLKPGKFPLKIATVGDLKRALEAYDDSATVHADYEFKLGDFLDEIDPSESPEDIRSQEFSLILEEFNEDLAIFKLTLEEESITQF